MLKTTVGYSMRIYIVRGLCVTTTPEGETRNGHYGVLLKLSWKKTTLKTVTHIGGGGIILK
jgi:hypothetical protein